MIVFNICNIKKLYYFTIFEFEPLFHLKVILGRISSFVFEKSFEVFSVAIFGLK